MSIVTDMAVSPKLSGVVGVPQGLVPSPTSRGVQPYSCGVRVVSNELPFFPGSIEIEGVRSSSPFM